MHVATSAITEARVKNMAFGAQLSRHRLSWEVVCDDFAQFAAVEFANKCCQFATDKSIDEASSFFEKAGKRFVDNFRKVYEEELQRIMHSGRGNAPKVQEDRLCREKSRTDSNESKSPKQSRVSRKFSLRLKSIFKKQEKENIEPQQDDPEVGVLIDISPQKESPQSTGNDKTGSGHDVIKEGFVHELINIDRQGDVELTWQKCRLVLARAPGGYMLEFYIPPKVTRFDLSVSQKLISKYILRNRKRYARSRPKILAT